MSKRVDHFAYRREDEYRRNSEHYNRSRQTEQQNKYWRFEMNTNHANRPATPQEQIRFNLSTKINEILMGTENSDKASPENVAYHTQRIIASIENEAGPIDAITITTMWEKMVFSALQTAQANIATGNNENVLRGVSECLRECVQEFEMNNLGLDHEGYQEYLRTRAAMQSHPGFVAGMTVAHTPVIARVSASVTDFPILEASKEATVSQPAPQPQLDQIKMNTTTNTNTASNNTAENTNMDMNAKISKTEALKQRATKLVIDMVPQSSGAKTTLKVVGGVAAAAAVSYVGYRAYKAGYLDTLKALVTRTVPTAEVIADTAGEVTSMASNVSSFFK